MTGPIALNMWHSTSTSTVEVWIIASADAGVYRVEVMESWGERWQSIIAGDGLGLRSGSIRLGGRVCRLNRVDGGLIMLRPLVV